MPDSVPHLPSSAFSHVKTVSVSDLALGGEVHDIFLLAAAQQGQARNGPYWRLEFRDATGSVGGKIWSPQSQEYPELQAGSLVRVKGRVTSYRDKLELAVESLRVLTEEESAGLDLGLFLPASPYNPDSMLAELTALVREACSHKPWKKFLLSLLTDAEIGPALRLAPAAKAMHHAYAGGLLEHTLSVSRLCMRIADHYPRLDRQILLAGAICHDLGKLWELTSGLGTDYTQAGRLIGHISLALDRLAPFIKKAGLEPELAEHLQHLILSHHGTLEFGSPKLPATAEALVLHYADNIDAKLQQVEAALSGLEEGQSGWSAYNPSLERFLFRAARSPEPEPARSRAASSGRAAGTAPASQTAQPQQPLPLVSQCSLLSKE